MKKILFAAATLAAIAAGPALAGSTKMSNADGMELKIDCTGSGCSVKGKNPGGKWGRVEKTAGGTENFNNLVAKYKGMGFTEK